MAPRAPLPLPEQALGLEGGVRPQRALDHVRDAVGARAQEKGAAGEAEDLHEAREQREEGEGEGGELQAAVGGDQLVSATGL